MKGAVDVSETTLPQHLPHSKLILKGHFFGLPKQDFVLLRLLVLHDISVHRFQNIERARPFVGGTVRLVIPLVFVLGLCFQERGSVLMGISWRSDLEFECRFCYIGLAVAFLDVALWVGRLEW